MMDSRTQFTIVAVVLFSLAAAAPAGSAKLDAAFDASGGLTLKLDGRTICDAPSDGAVTAALFRDPGIKLDLFGYDGDRKADAGETKPTSVAFDAATTTLTESYPWGEVVRAFNAGPDRIDCEITVRNTSDKTLYELNMKLWTLELPEGTKAAPVSEATYFGQTIGPMVADSLSGPLVLPLLAGERAVVACSAEALKHLELRWNSAARKAAAPKATAPADVKHNDPEAQRLAEQEAARVGKLAQEEGQQWTLSLKAGGDQLVWEGIYTSRPVAPGASDGFTVSLRVGDGADPVAPAADVCKAYGQAHPMVVKWPDRRPILRTFIGDWFPFHAPGGPDIPKPQGVPVPEAFKAKVMASADSMIASMKAVNAQGMILFNVEGSTVPSIKYVGCPRMVEFMCPEMDQIADEYFKKIRDAGFRPGVCIRPTTLIAAPGCEPNTFVYRHRSPLDANVVDLLSSKIEYAKKRWGCTLFFIDSNISYRWPINDEQRAAWPKDANGQPRRYRALMSAQQWQELARRHPDVLLIPEHSYLLCYSATAPYDAMNMGQGAPAGVTPAVVRATWPEAFKMLTGDNPTTKYWAKTVQCFAQNDVLSVNSPAEDGGKPLNAARAQAEFTKLGAPPSIAAMDAAALRAAATDPNGDARTRFFAARSLAQTADANALATLLDSEDWLIRKVAIDSVSKPQHLAIADKLLTIAAGRDSLRIAAADAFGRIGQPAVTALTALTAIAREPKQPSSNSQAVAAAAVRAIGGIAGAEALDALVAMLKDVQVPSAIRQQAAGALGQKIAGPDKAAAGEALVAMLQDPSVRIAAAGALGRSDDKEAIAVLRDALETEKKMSTADPKYVEALTKILDSKK